MNLQKSYHAIEDETARKIFELRFWNKVEKKGADECWPWKGTKSKSGYGIVCIKKPTYAFAHRVVLELSGEVLGESIVMHSCDNPCCVNPSHLRPGTNADNMRDMFAKGRRKQVALRGSAHPLAKLDERQVRAIRKLRGKESYKSVMKRFGISRSNLYRIWDDDDPHWSHVKPKFSKVGK